MKPRFKDKNFICSGHLTIILFLILFFSFISLLKVLRQKNVREAELNSKEKELAKLKKENEALLRESSTKGLDFLKEREAKLKFGLKRPGEKVIIIVPQAKTGVKDIAPVKKKTSNPFKWWRSFFGEGITKNIVNKNK